MKKYISILLCFFLILTSCQKEVDKKSEIYYSFTDDLNNTCTLYQKPKRVVSLMGSYAESYLLSGGELVGVTEDAVSERNLNLPNAKIIGSIKTPSNEAILALNPDFVIMSSNIASHVEFSKILENLKIPFAFFKVEFFEDYLNQMKIFTDITKKSELYEKNALSVKIKIDEILNNLPNVENPPKVLLLRAVGNSFKTKKEDNFVGKMLKDLNTINVAESSTSQLEDFSPEAIINENPEYIFIVPMGKTLEFVQNYFEQIKNNPAFSTVSAISNDKVFILPKELFHYKPNVRWFDSYEYLSKILYSQE